MFVDARQLDDGQEIDCDVCIVGAGAAGITLARELAGTGKQVCLVESGGLDFDGDTQSLCDGESIGHEYFPLDAARLRYFGGTTNHWAGQCATFREIDFEARAELPHSGWPIALRDVSPYYPAARKYCQLDAVTDVALERWRLPNIPAPQGATPATISTQLFQKSPPTRFGTTYRADIEKAKEVRCLLFANLLEFVPSDGRGTIQHAAVATLTGKRFSVKANEYVLACGGLENPRLLLNCRQKTPNGLGNDNDQVGRFFMEHLEYSNAARLVLAPAAKNLPLASADSDMMLDRNYLTLSLASDVVRRRGGVSMGFFGIHQKSIAENAWSETTRALKEGHLPANFAHHLAILFDNPRATAHQLADAIHIGFLRRLAPSVPQPVSLVIVAEQSPNPASRVVLTGERDPLGQRRMALDWRIARQDVKDVRRGVELLGSELRRLKLGAMQLLIDPDFAPSIEVQGAWHHMGTTRMSSDPKRGVVDADCRVHGIGNLYVAGSSVFATGSFVNPTLTIVALALRLADHLKDKRS